MQIVIAILMYLGYLQSPAQFNDPHFQAQYQPEIQQIQAQVPAGLPGACVGKPGDPNSLAITVDGTPVIIDIQEF